MHIAEGYLPVAHCIGWTVASAPFVIASVRRVTRLMRESPEKKLMLAASGAFLFALTALKLPSVTGSSSHPAGTALGVSLLGPLAMPALSTLVLVFQALLLAHGGLSTLGANVFSLGIAGPLAMWTVYGLMRRSGFRWELACGVAAVVGNLATYLMTSFQLALAFPDVSSGFWGAFVKFAGIFFVTQIPIAIVEGAFTVMVLRNLAPALKHWRLEGARA